MHLHPNCNVQRFLQDAMEHLHSHGIKIKFHRSKKIRIGKKLGARGYFDGKTLAVAKNCKEWVELFVHEYCHFLQMIDNQKDYVQVDRSNYHDNMITDWISGKYTNEREFQRTMHKIMRMEIDCEKRAVALILDYNLPIDVEDYIREANLIIYLYHVMISHKLIDNSSIRLKLKKKVKKEMPQKLSKTMAKKVPAKMLARVVSYF